MAENKTISLVIITKLCDMCEKNYLSYCRKYKVTHPAKQMHGGKRFSREDNRQETCMHANLESGRNKLAR